LTGDAENRRLHRAFIIRPAFKDSESPLTKIVIPLLTLTAIAEKRPIEKTLD
jgi:hypothetical protein